MIYDNRGSEQNKNIEYHVGDIVEISRIILGGYLIGNKTQAFFSIQLPKIIGKDVTNVNISAKITTLQNSQYLSNEAVLNQKAHSFSYNTVNLSYLLENTNTNAINANPVGIALMNVEINFS